MEASMLQSTLQSLGRAACQASSLFFAPAVDRPAPDMPIDLKGLEERLRAAQVLARPGFMALHAVREGAHIVDFEWDNASIAATCLLRGSTRGLVGERLVEVLAGCPGRGAVFNQYRCVVEFGGAHAVQQPVERNQCVEVLRHTAVRVRDGVAVRLTNLSALRREAALRREIHARALMVNSGQRA
jgi:hypothetical protein